MVEGTGGIDFVLPVILAIVLSNWVAHHIHHAGAYEADMQRLGKFQFWLRLKWLFGISWYEFHRTYFN